MSNARFWYAVFAVVNLAICTAIPGTHQSRPSSLSPTPEKPLEKRVQITQFISDTLRSDDPANPNEWHMRLEHVEVLIPIQLAVLGLRSFYSRLRLAASPNIGYHHWGRALSIAIDSLQLEFYCRQDERIPYSMIHAFVKKMEELVGGGLTGLYNGELEDAATGIVTWIKFSLRRRDLVPSGQIILLKERFEYGE